MPRKAIDGVSPLPPSHPRPVQLRPRPILPKERPVSFTPKRRDFSTPIKAPGSAISQPVPRTERTVAKTTTPTAPPKITRKRHLLTSSAQYIIVVVVALVAAASTTVGQLFILAFALYSLVLRRESQKTFVIALLLLISIPVFQLLNQTGVADNVAIYTYELLVFGTLQAILELKWPAKKILGYNNK